MNWLDQDDLRFVQTLTDNESEAIHDKLKVILGVELRN